MISNHTLASYTPSSQSICNTAVAIMGDYVILVALPSAIPNGFRHNVALTVCGCVAPKANQLELAPNYLVFVRFLDA